MFESFFIWLRGIRLLRYPEVVVELGQQKTHLSQIFSLRKKFPNAKISSKIILKSYHKNQLNIGTETSINEGTILSFGGYTNGRGNISIGKETWIGQYNNLRSSEGGSIQIGNNCLISQFCTLVGTNHNMSINQPIIFQGTEKKRGGIILENDIWLGAGVTILPGVTICKGAVIGANSVVTKNVPEYEIWAGIPACRIGKRQ